MPITDIASYVTTGNEFEGHWTDVNADRLANALPELTLIDGYGLSNLTADIAAIQAAITHVTDLDNALDVALGDRDNQKAGLRSRVIEFREAVNYRLKGTGYVRALPDTPQPTSSEQHTLGALDDMASVWTRINAETGVPNFTPPLLLRGGYDLATFQSEGASLRDAYKAVSDAENDLRIARGERDLLLDPFRDRLVSYRQGIEVEYGPDHPFTTSLPDVYPHPGSTPDPVPLSGQWDAASMSASFHWNESSEPTLDHYELRMSPGASYEASSATVIGNFPPGTSTTETVAGLSAPGDVASFKIFVILSTGNEAGSNTVTITRP